MVDVIEKVLIVDDEEMFLDILSNAFSGSNFTAITVNNAKDALKIIEESDDKISLVVSDVNMPDMNGYQLCRAIKEIDRLESIPVIFSSALETIEDKIKGYDAGADDYVVKPIVPEELILKVDHLIKNRHVSDEIKNQLGEASNTAMQAMTYSSDLGRVVNFYEEAMLAVSFEDLAHKLFSLTHSYNLKCSLYIDDGLERIIIADTGHVTPLEEKVFEQIKSQGRFFDFGRRTVVNYDNHSLLVKNMPIEDEAKYGLIKDILGALCNAVSAKLSILINQIKNERQKNTVFKILGDAIDDIDSSVRGLQLTNMKIIEDMNEKINTVVMGLSLLEETENRIEDIVTECLDSTNINFYKGLKLNDIFDSIRLRINESIKSEVPQIADNYEMDSCSEPELF